MSDVPSVYPGHRVIAMFPFHDERDKLVLLAPKLRPGIVDTWLPVDDASTDGGSALLTELGIEPLRQERRRGIGAAIRRVIHHGRAHGYDLIVGLAGNN